VKQRPDGTFHKCSPYSGYSRNKARSGLVGVLGDLGVDTVHQHAKSGLLLPTRAGDFGSARSTDRTGTGGRCHQR
jgi:hypothetical protein